MSMTGRVRRHKYLKEKKIKGMCKMRTTMAGENEIKNEKPSPSYGFEDYRDENANAKGPGKHDRHAGAWR